MEDTRDYVLGRPPTYDEIEWRLMSRTKAKDKATVAIYQTSRTAMDRLDEAYGVGRWSSAYDVIVKEPDVWVVQCTIQAGGFYWTDVGGAENDPDKPGGAPPYKSAYSDAFKRAAVQAVPGFRYLYTHTLGGNYYALKESGSFYFHPDAIKEIENDVRVAIGKMWQDWNNRLRDLDVGGWIAWDTPGQALNWAVTEGVFGSTDAARESFAKMVNTCFGGRLKQDSVRDAFRHWYVGLSNQTKKDW